MSRQLDVAPAVRRRRRPASARSSAVRTAADDVRGLPLAQRGGVRLVGVRGRRRAPTTGGPAGRGRADGRSGRYAGCASGAGVISWPNTWLTQSRTGAAVRKLVSSTDRLADASAGRAGRWRCRRAGTGRSTASGRRRRTALPAGTATSAQSVLIGGGAAGDAHRQLDLDRVGVLELVEQQPPVALLQPRPAPPRRAAAAQQVAGQHQQVVELQPALGPRVPRHRSSTASATRRASRRRVDVDDLAAQLRPRRGRAARHSSRSFCVP